LVDIFDRGPGKPAQYEAGVDGRAIFERGPAVVYRLIIDIERVAGAG